MKELAAIMMTDIIGYTKLTRQKESLVREISLKHKEILHKNVSCCNGRFIHIFGDNSLSFNCQSVQEYLNLNMYLTMNQPAKTEKILENLLESEKTAPNSKAPFNIALIYAAMDKPDEMFRFLIKSVEQKDNSVIYILGYSAFKKNRSDPRFTEIVKKIGLWK